MQKECAEWRRPAEYQKQVDLLVRYSRGEIDFEAVIPDRCDVPVVPP